MGKSSKFIGDYKFAATVVAAAGTGVFADLSGAANKLAKIKRIKVSGMTLTAVGYLIVQAKKYSTVATGGTAVAGSEVPVNSGYPAAGAVARTFTAAPTAGTDLGTVATDTAMGESTTAAATAFPQSIEFKFKEGEEIVLASAAESLGLNFAVAPATAVTLSVEIDWSEESN